MSEFKRIIENAPIADVVGQYITLKKAGALLVACCPFHDDKSPSFKVNVHTNSCHCFGCGAGGDAVDFIELHLGVSTYEALKVVASLTGQAPPKSLPKNDRTIAKSDAVLAVWNACPVASESSGLGSKLAARGWPVRRYDHDLIASRAKYLGHLFDDISGCGIASFTINAGATSGPIYRDYARSLVIAGHKLGSEPAPTGFIVIGEDQQGRLSIHQRMTSLSSPASIIVNFTRFADRNNVKNVLVTDNPLRAMQAHRYYISACPTAEHWRLQDVRNLVSAYPSARFITDQRHFSDASLHAWLTHLGPCATALQSIENCMDSEQITEPALSSYIQRLTQDFATCASQYPAQSANSNFIQTRANALLDALSRAPACKLLVGRELLRCGFPVAYEIEFLSRKEVVAPRIPARLAALPNSTVYKSEGSSTHLLEAALLGLPNLDSALWASIPIEEFGNHAPMAQAITDFLSSLSMQAVSFERHHAAFWVFLQTKTQHAPVSKPLLAYWQTRLAQNPTYWEKPAGSASYEARSLREELMVGLKIFLRQVNNKKLLSMATIATIDPDVEGQLRASY